MRRNRHMEDAPEFEGHYTINGRQKYCAYYVAGWETEPDEDTEWSGIENRTGNVIVCMVGDDYFESVDPDDLEQMNEEDYCAECGQIGCTADGRERAES